MKDCTCGKSEGIRSDHDSNCSGYYLQCKKPSEVRTEELCLVGAGQCHCTRPKGHDGPHDPFAEPKSWYEYLRCGCKVTSSNHPWVKRLIAPRGEILSMCKINSCSQFSGGVDG